MSNTAQVFDDGVCVYFNSQIKATTIQKTILAILNTICISFNIFLMIIMSGEHLTDFSFAFLYFIFPIITVVPLLIYTFWNLVGKEYIIINARTISCKRDYGLYNTNWKLKQFKRLYYRINEEKRKESSVATISFIDHNQMGFPIIILSSTIQVPKEKIQELVTLLDFIFTVENLTTSEENYISLN